MITPLIFGAQRFSLSSGLGIEKSPMQDAVASSMAWTASGVSIWSSEDPSREAEIRSSRRFLSDAARFNSTADAVLASPPQEWLKMLNILTFVGVQIVLVFLVQILVTRAWQKWVNKSYYAEQRRRRSKSFLSRQATFLSRQVSVAAKRGVRFAQDSGSSGTGKSKVQGSPVSQPSQRRFVPFPTFLVWPSSLIFVVTISCSGLAKTSVALLAAEAVRHDGLSSSRVALAIVILVLLMMIYVGLIVDLVHFRRKHAKSVVWKASTKAHAFGEVQDPLMFASAKGLVAMKGSTLLLKEKIKSTSLNTIDVLDKVADMVAPRRFRSERVTGSSSAPLPASFFDFTAMNDTTLPPPSRLPSPQLDSDLQGASATMAIPSSGACVVEWSAPQHTRLAAEAPAQLKRVKSFKEGRSCVSESLTRRGLPQRCLGAFSVPPTDMIEPNRTERILAAPFALRRESPADSFHQRSSSVLFRVNGTSLWTSNFRLLVIGATMSIGVLAGFRPLVRSGTVGALLQCTAVVSLQLGLACFCLCCSPDADLIFSKLAGTQFLLEGLSGLALLIASGLPFLSTARVTLQLTSFVLGTLAIFVPIFQLVEQRIITPAARVVRTKGCNPLALGGALIVLAAALPAAISKAIKAFTGGPNVDRVEQTATKCNSGGACPAPLQRSMTVSDACCGATRQLAILGGRNIAAGNLKVTKLQKAAAPEPKERIPRSSVPKGDGLRKHATKMRQISRDTAVSPKPLSSGGPPVAQWV